MSRTTKALTGFIGIALLIAAIAFWLLISNLDSLVKRVIEDVGSDTLGTKVSLSSAAISLQDAQGELRGLSIANPAGFSSPHAFDLGAIALALDAASLTGDEIILHSVVIDQAKLTFEQSGTRSNLQELLDNLDDGSSSATTDDAESDTRLVIEKLQLKGANLQLISDQMAEPIQITLQQLTLRNIGTPGAGVTPEQAAQAILGPVLQQAQKAAQDRLKDELKDRAREKLNEESGELIDSATKKLFGR